jgi:hypothetical protein
VFQQLPSLCCSQRVSVQHSHRSSGQRRIGTMGVGGGGSLGELMSDSRSIGEDIAKFLARWARGEALE